MSKLVDRPIELVTDALGRPLRFRWKQRWYQVDQILDAWREAGAWWEGESEKTFFRLATRQGIYEVYVDTDNRWSLYKVLD